MSNKYPRIYFLVVLLVLFGIVTFFILRPFLYTLILAVVLSVALHPLHKRTLSATGGRRTLATLLTILVLIVFIVAPLSFIGVQIFQEAKDIYSSIATAGDGNQFLRDIESLMRSVPLPAGISLGFLEGTDINQYLQQGLRWLVEHIGSFFASVFNLLLHGFVFLVAFYYLMKDGDELRQRIISASPLADADDEFIFGKLELAINSVVRGGLVVAVAQGILTSIGFSIFGVPNSALWGTVAAVAALIPGVGTALVTGPAVIFLFIFGSPGAAIGLLIWGTLAVGLVDNLLGPKLIGRGVHIHPFLLLISVLGGISLFGPIGFLLGPLTLSLFLALSEIYASLIKETPSRPK